MKPEKMNRRDFLKRSSILASATLLVALTPGGNILPSKGFLPSQDSDPGKTNFTEKQDKTHKVLIVYDTVYGNTQKIAEGMFEGISLNRSTCITKSSEASVADLEGIDLLIVGAPTHGGNFTEAMKDYLAGMPANALKGVHAATFDTSFTAETQGAFIRFLMKILGFAAPKIAKKLANEGAEVLSSETFYVLDTEGPLKVGEIERASEWAVALVDQL